MCSAGLALRREVAGSGRRGWCLVILAHLDAGLTVPIRDLLKRVRRTEHEVVLEGALTDLAGGIRLETDAFLRLAASDNARQLIADFFAKRKKG